MRTTVGTGSQRRTTIAVLAIFTSAFILAASHSSPNSDGVDAGANHAIAGELASVMAAGATGHGPLPRRLSETGLYNANGDIDARNRPFSPQYPLWSDGAIKLRWIYLPQGSQVDISDVDLWKFPVGTKLWKQFSWDGRKVETRILWRTSAESWAFGTYVWTEDQTDALLAPEVGIPDIIEIVPGKRHSIPSMTDCNSCHAASPAVVLGFNALQLSDDRDPLAPHAEPLPEGAATIKSLLDANLLDPPRMELADFPPRIRAANPNARAALGYLSANCGGCHNNAGPLAHLGLNLLHNEKGGGNSPEPALMTAVGAPGRYRIPGLHPDSSHLVTPGNPARSAIFFRMHSRRPSSQMPPLGTTIRDDEALQLVKRWIDDLQVPDSALAGSDLTHDWPAPVRQTP